MSLDLNIIFTHPHYRRKGAGDLIMQWGLKKADEMGVEMWLDATVYGIPLYKKYGFRIVHENTLHPKTDKPNDEWKKIEGELKTMTMWQMWRPIGGKFEEGKTIQPVMEPQTPPRIGTGEQRQSWDARYDRLMSGASTE